MQFEDMFRVFLVAKFQLHRRLLQFHRCCSIAMEIKFNILHFVQIERRTGQPLTGVTSPRNHSGVSSTRSHKEEGSRSCSELSLRRRAVAARSQPNGPEIDQNG